MLRKTGLVLPIGACGYIVTILQICNGFCPEFQALFEATERQSLVLFIEAVGPGDETAGSERPSVLIITAIDEGLL